MVARSGDTTAPTFQEIEVEIEFESQPEGSDTLVRLSFSGAMTRGNANALVDGNDELRIDADKSFARGRRWAWMGIAIALPEIILCSEIKPPMRSLRCSVTRTVIEMSTDNTTVASPEYS